MNLLCLTLSTLLVLTSGKMWRTQSPSAFNTAYEWTRLQFTFPNDRLKQQALKSGSLIPENAIPIDVQPNYYSRSFFRLYVTTPRFQHGVPYTLSTVHESANGLLLKPYPNYEFHDSGNETNCDAIISAFRVTMNECNQLWVIDAGSSGADGKCPPKLLLFNVFTDEVIHRYNFPKSVYTPGASLFINLVVDVRDPDRCQDTMIYVADVNNHGLVVYDVMQNKSWRVENRFMYPDPQHGLLSLAGKRFMLMDGIFGMATDKKNLYFHPLASTEEFVVPLNVLDDSALFEDSAENMHQSFRSLGKRSSACAASAMDKRNNLYCVTLNPIELIVWNVATPYDWLHIKTLPIRPEELEFVSGMKVVRHPHGYDELWMLSNKYQNMATDTQDFNEVNFRIVVISLRSPAFGAPYTMGYIR